MLDSAKQLTHLLPGSRLAYIPRSKAMVFNEGPEVFGALVREVTSLLERAC